MHVVGQNYDNKFHSSYTLPLINNKVSKTKNLKVKITVLTVEGPLLDMQQEKHSHISAMIIAKNTKRVLV